MKMKNKLLQLDKYVIQQIKKIPKVLKFSAHSVGFTDFAPEDCTPKLCTLGNVINYPEEVSVHLGLIQNSKY